MAHSDCEGEWTLAEIPKLERELVEIEAAFKRLPPEEPQGTFEHAAEYREGARSLYDCFHEVNGENLLRTFWSCAPSRKSTNDRSRLGNQTVDPGAAPEIGGL